MELVSQYILELYSLAFIPLFYTFIFTFDQFRLMASSNVWVRAKGISAR